MTRKKMNHIRKNRIAWLLLFAVLCAFPLSAAAGASDKALDPGPDLSEAQRSWLPDLEMYAPFWDRFQTVDVPGEQWFRVYALPGDVYALFEYRQS